MFSYIHISPQLFEEAVGINQHSRSGFVIETPHDNGQTPNEMNDARR